MDEASLVKGVEASDNTLYYSADGLQMYTQQVLDSPRKLP